MSYCADLFYPDGTEYQPLPSWARFFIDAGADFYGTLDPDQRIVLAFTVPTRAYVAALLALGVIVNGIGVGGGKAHSDKLKGLAIDTPLFVFKVEGEKTCQAKGLYKGYSIQKDRRPNRQNDDVSYITVQLGKVGNCCHTYPIDMWASIQVAAFPAESLPQHETWREIDADPPFVVRTLGQRRARDLAIRSRQECIILGEANTLRQELVNTPIAARARDGTFVEGCLQNIVRSRRFSTTLAAFRSDVIPIDSPSVTKTNGDLSAPIAILDGSAAYLKWRHLFRASDRIIVLDRANRTFEEAVYTLNEEYRQERTGEVDLGLGTIPPGVDVMAFGEPVL